MWEAQNRLGSQQAPVFADMAGTNFHSTTPARLNFMTINIANLERAEYGWGDWHDKPLRWVVSGPGLAAPKRKLIQE